MWINVRNKTNILVCGECTECDGDFLMKEIDYHGSYILMNNPTRVSFEGNIYILASLLEEDSASFERDLSTYTDYIDDEELYFYLQYCIEKQKWNEGTLICEREIAKRGLNKVGVKERFEL